MEVQVSFITNILVVCIACMIISSIFHSFVQTTTYSIILEPGTAPRNVEVRPLSSSTMVIQWHEPETPNGQVTVRMI